MIMAEPHPIQESQLKRFATAAYSEDVPIRMIRQMASELLSLRQQIAQMHAPAADDIMNSKLSAYGEFVRAMRQSRGLYLKQMADFIGIGSAHMLGVEFGRHALTKEILQKTFEFFAQAPAVEPAQRCNCCGYLVTDSEHRGCLRAAQQEPAQAVPVAVIA